MSTVYSPQVGSPRSSRRLRQGLIFVGLILVAIGGYSLYNLNSVHSFQSTFNILPLKFFKIAANLRDQTLITGHFQETSARPINFLLMSSVQFAAFQASGNNASLYSVENQVSGDLSFTSTAPDTYYLVFTHGSGLLSSTETVSFQRTYTSLDEFNTISGVALLALGVVEIFWGVRLRRTSPILALKA